MHVRSGLVQPFRSQRGFSLTELLVVCAALGLLMAGLLVIQTGGTSAYVIGSSRVAAQQNGRVALEMMVRELRSAQFVTLVTSDTDITFVDENGVAVQYQASSGTLNRIVAGASTPLIGGVTSISFTCYSAFDNVAGTGTTTTTPNVVRAIRIQLTTGSDIPVASYADANQHATMESWVQLRNCLPSRLCE
jgi:prepilin-type N-terminal cleavage/methylation domain-containing protein